MNVPGKSQRVKVNALIDSGCDSTLCTHSLIERLGCNVKKKYKIWVNHACGSKQLDAKKVDDLEIRGRNPSSKVFRIRDIESLPELPSHGNPVGTQQIDSKRFPHLKDIAIPEFNSKDIDIILGTNNEHLLILEDRRSPENGNGPAAWLTPLGWTLVGKDFLDKGMQEQERHELNCSFIETESFS